jgi:hypothetical protein
MARRSIPEAQEGLRLGIHYRHGGNDFSAIFCSCGIESLSGQTRGPGWYFSRSVVTRLSGGPSSVDQQCRAGGKFRCVGSKVKDGSRDFLAGAQPAYGMQR